LPTQAFVPGMITSIVALVLGSLLTKPEELPDILRT
jgi:hypothetical protein